MAQDERDRRSAADAVGVLPALGRLAAGAWWHAAERSVGLSIRMASRVARTAMGDDRSAPPASRPAGSTRPPERSASEASRSTLRERGAELLAQSADVAHAEDLHPAYARILENLSPDEARILRLLATNGPEQAIDVRSGLPLVSELVAPGLNMIGSEAGCRHPDRVPAYLDNLNRLGLIWFSRETIRDVNRYQVLEAQPDTAEAMRKAGLTSRTVRRSIHLTPFGTDFCEVCLPLDSSSESEEPEGGDVGLG